MLSQLPINLSQVGDQNIDKQILRAGLIAELDAISVYEQMAALATSPKIKKVLMEVAREEKEHVGEFKTLLLQLDKQQAEELEEGEKEVEELLS